MSQNVQIGISKFHGIWTLALTDTVTLKTYKKGQILFLKALLSKLWVDQAVEDGDEQHDEKWIDDLHLVGLDEGGSNLARGFTSLRNPPGASLVKQCPEQGDRNENLQDLHKFLGVFYYVVVVL